VVIVNQRLVSVRPSCCLSSLFSNVNAVTTPRVTAASCTG